MERNRGRELSCHAYTRSREPTRMQIEADLQARGMHACSGCEWGAIRRRWSCNKRCLIGGHASNPHAGGQDYTRSLR